MPVGSRVKVVEELPEGLAREVEARVRAEGAVALRGLTKLKLGKRAGAQLIEALARAGLESTGKHVRVPLAEQLGALLAKSPTVPRTELGKRIKGATRAEIDRALRASQVALVVRDGKVHAAASPHALPLDELRALDARVSRLAKLLRSAKTRKATLLRDEVAALLGTSPEVIVLDAIARLERPGLPLVFVPEVARAVAAAIDTKALHAGLLAAAGKRRLELRPESSVGLLSDEDRALCPRTADGTVLSYVRRTEA